MNKQSLGDIKVKTVIYVKKKQQQQQQQTGRFQMCLVVKKVLGPSGDFPHGGGQSQEKGHSPGEDLRGQAIDAAEPS